MRSALPLLALAALLAAPALADPPGQKAAAKVQRNPGPPNIGGGNVPPIDADKSKLLPAVQKAGMAGMGGMTGMEGMEGMVGMGGSNLPAIQAPNIGGDANQLPAAQLPALPPAGGMPGGMGPAGFKH